MNVVDPVTCEPLPGVSASDNSVLLAQYKCLHGSITEGLIPSLTAVQQQIVENGTELKRLKHQQTLGLVVGEGQQAIGDSGWPSYSIAFVFMCVGFLFMLVAVAVFAVLRLGVSTKNIATVVVAASFVVALFIVLVQRYL